MTGSGGVAVPVVGSERFCRSDALNVLSRLLGAGFGTGTVCAVESVAAPATETATIKANAARVPAKRERFGRSEFRNSCQRKILVCFPAQSSLEAKGYFRENISPPPVSPGLI